MPSLELRIPPPIVTVVVGALMWLAAWLAPQLACPLPARYVLAGALLIVGLAVSISGAVAFRRAGTTVNPLQPQKASVLVTSGLYRRTRNPMYLGLLIVLCAWALFLANWAALLGLPLFVLYLTRFQIIPEERALTAVFGDAFARYRSTVRRWA